MDFIKVICRENLTYIAVIIFSARVVDLEYHKSHSKLNSIRAYRLVLTQFCKEFESTDLKEITTEGL